MEARWRGEKLASLRFCEPHPTASSGKLCSAIQKHLAGEPQSFDAVELCYEEVSPFARQVYQAARQVPAGSTTTYGELAKAMDNPGAARAVGTALGRNPFLVVVPCHRVLGSQGFSAPGGVQTKIRMLMSEGVEV